ncbi:hypothetical protein P7F60_00285 [Rhizobium sp. YJ-22]|uniref:hypothetical protein n=1 Tax=Rhizobium sp. YJ-22 TaxID=3037556 RepID=UPI001AD2C8F9|nr:hypothetical protein [Rhizobium sp. YJ-22]MBN9028956.1 hypothetical protein [Hyphomicrobiales bacterium]MDG3574806.1 hypothetical protein [Rhizobium sp. YJ-22]
MEVVARRLTIIMLSAFVFAMGFSAAVNHSAQSPLKMRSGTAAPCYHTESPYCTAIL